MIRVATTSQIERNVDASPFDINRQAAYRYWRTAKLNHFPATVEELTVDIHDPYQLTLSEQINLLRNMASSNMAIYQSHSKKFDKNHLRAMCAQLGLSRLDENLCADDDAITSIQIEPKGQKQEYIPYSEQPINWHTDGYYNSPNHRIHGMVLHCVTPAEEGGENAFIDHERIYIELREQNPDFIRALMQPDVMTIPANVQNGKEIRPEQTGPVFYVGGEGQYLHMRYTARTRSIAWKDDALTKQAVSALEALLNGNADYIFRTKLKAGQGVVTNNVLHSRSKINDSSEVGQQRLVYRARFYDRVGKVVANSSVR